MSMWLRLVADVEASAGGEGGDVLGCVEFEGEVAFLVFLFLDNGEVLGFAHDLDVAFVGDEGLVEVFAIRASRRWIRFALRRRRRWCFCRC